MSVTYRSFRGKSLSREWEIVLSAAAKDGVRFTLNSGHRTMAEQQRLVNEKGVWSPSNPTGAAVPSPHAPHIREGRFDHALDVDFNDGSTGRLDAWLRSKGVEVSHPIGREPWHGEVDAEDLARLARKLDDPLRHYTATERRWIREYDELKHAHRGEERRTALRHAMTAQRKRLWRAAQPRERGGDGHGWNHANRRARYRSLLARTQ